MIKKDIGLYIHIPFCKSKCHYCDFVSFANKEEYMEEYVNSLIKEIEHINLQRYNIKTIYIGGGTPSILDSRYIKQILNSIKTPYVGAGFHPCPENKERQNTNKDNVWEVLHPSYNQTEITIEINPGTVDKEKLRDYIETGINRLSIGLQSTNNRFLQEIGRIHKYEDFIEAYKDAREAGFKNINVDLMLGLPNQSIEDLEESLNRIIESNPEHISVYSLILEEGTKLYNDVNSGKLILPNEDTERRMYWLVKEKLEGSGYIHYEISNFAKPGFKSKHNSDCWEQKEYIGIGAAAHSYLNGVRYSNIESLEKYIKNIENDEFEKNIIIYEEQTEESKKREYMLLGLRKLEGISIKEFKNRFIENPIFIYHNELEKIVKKGLLEIDGDYIKLTDKGLDLANLVWEEFV